MNIYRIQHKVKTLAYLCFGKIEGTKIEIDGYRIENIYFNIQKGAYGDAWIIEKEIKAENCEIALNIFRKDFERIAEKIGFISQCYFEYKDQSFLIEKLEDNEEGMFLLRQFNDRKPVGLNFGEKELENYQKIESINNRGFMYLQACNNTIAYYPKLSLMLAATEAIAGTIEKTKEDGTKIKTYNREKMKKILGNDYYNELFGEEGVRHKIQHGDFQQSVILKDHVKLIHKNIINFFNEEYGLHLNTDVISPQRHFFGNLDYITFFLSFKDKNENIDLRNIPENIDEEMQKPNNKFTYYNINSESY